MAFYHCARSGCHRSQRASSFQDEEVSRGTDDVVQLRIRGVILIRHQHRADKGVRVLELAHFVLLEQNINPSGNSPGITGGGGNL